MLRVVLFYSHLDNTFWVEADLHASYLITVLSPSSKSGLTPYEALSGRKPNISSLIVFGCAGQVPVSKELWKRKFEINAKFGIFFGLKDDLWKFWINTENKIVLSNHVRFQEYKFPGQAEVPGEGSLYKNHVKGTWWVKKRRCSCMYIIHGNRTLLHVIGHRQAKKIRMRSQILRSQTLIKRYWGCHPNCLAADAQKGDVRHQRHMCVLLNTIHRSMCFP